MPNGKRYWSRLLLIREPSWLALKSRSLQSTKGVVIKGTGGPTDVYWYFYNSWTRYLSDIHNKTWILIELIIRFGISIKKSIDSYSYQSFWRFPFFAKKWPVVPSREGSKRKSPKNLFRLFFDVRFWLCTDSRGVRILISQRKCKVLNFRFFRDPWGGVRARFWMENSRSVKSVKTIQIYSLFHPDFECDIGFTLNFVVPNRSDAVRA